MVAGDQHHRDAQRLGDMAKHLVQQRDRRPGWDDSVVNVAGDQHQLNPLGGEKVIEPPEPGPLVLEQRVFIEGFADVPVGGM